MFLRYTTRTGHFNMLNPSEESFSCNVVVYDDKANRVKNCNFTAEYELNGSEIDEIQIEIEESLKRYWSTNKDREEMLAFLKEHEEEIEKGNVKRRLSEIKSEVEALEEERDRLLK